MPVQVDCDMMIRFCTDKKALGWPWSTLERVCVCWLICHHSIDYGSAGFSVLAGATTCMACSSGYFSPVSGTLPTYPSLVILLPEVIVIGYEVSCLVSVTSVEILCWCTVQWHLLNLLSWWKDYIYIIIYIYIYNMRWRHDGLRWSGHLGRLDNIFSKTYLKLKS